MSGDGSKEPQPQTHGTLHLEPGAVNVGHQDEPLGYLALAGSAAL